MTLREVEPGSIVVIDENGVRSIVELGCLLGENPKKKRIAWSAIVHELDDQTLLPTAPRTARGADPDVAVVFIVASVFQLRRLRDIGLAREAAVRASSRPAAEPTSKRSVLDVAR